MSECLVNQNKMTTIANQIQLLKDQFNLCSDLLTFHPKAEVLGDLIFCIVSGSIDPLGCLYCTRSVKSSEIDQHFMKIDPFELNPKFDSGGRLKIYICFDHFPKASLNAPTNFD